VFLSNNFKKGQKLDIRAKQKSPVIFKITGLYVGGDGRDRTVDLLTASQALSRASLLR